MTEHRPSKPDRKDPPLQLPFRLTRTPELMRVVSAIRTTPPDWKKIAMDVTCSKRLPNIGYLAELHVGNVIEQVATSDPVLKDRIKQDVVKENDITAQYVFLRNPVDSLVCSRRGDGLSKTVTEYDHIIMVDGLPVVIEVKTQIAKQSSQTQGSLNYALRQEAIIQKIVPIQERFSTERLAYVFAVNPERISHSPSQQRFREAGGLIVSFGSTLADFRAEAAKLH